MATKTSTDKARADALALVMAAPNGASIARILGTDGRTVRNYARHTLGLYPNDVTDGAKHAGSHVAITDDDKRALFDRFYKPSA